MSKKFRLSEPTPLFLGGLLALAGAALGALASPYLAALFF